MDFTGRLSSLGQDYETNKQVLAILADNDISRIFDDLKKHEKIFIQVKKYRKKRSLDANAYYWALCGKLADKLNSSKDEVHNIMLQRYGQIESGEDGKPIAFSMLSKVDMEKRTDIHVKAIGHRMHNGKSVTDYALLKGSHEYNTKEMSILINGIISECDEQGIETLTPDDINKMMEVYHAKRKDLGVTV